MPDLIAELPLGSEEVAHGAARLRVLPQDPMHLIAPYPGAVGALEQAVSEAYGVALPAAGRSADAAGAVLRWAGRDQILLIGPDRPAAGLSESAAVTDVGDVYVRLRLGGPEAAGDVLARLVPLDLRPARFGPGHTAKTLLGHIAAQVTATEDGIEIMVMRSFARSAFDEIVHAMEGVAGRRALV